MVQIFWWFVDALVCSQPCVQNVIHLYLFSIYDSLLLSSSIQGGEASDRLIASPMMRYYQIGPNAPFYLWPTSDNLHKFYAISYVKLHHISFLINEYILTLLFVRKNPLLTIKYLSSMLSKRYVPHKRRCMCPFVHLRQCNTFNITAVSGTIKRAWARDHATSLLTTVFPPPGHQSCGTDYLNSFGNRTSPSDNSNDRWKRLFG